MQLFEESFVEISDCLLRIHRIGQGPPLLLLHGFPQTLRAWHSVARLMSGQFSLILVDLPGYGYSHGLRSTLDHSAHSKRAMSGVLVQLMHDLGYSRFSVAGHDRGGQVAYRMALDHPERIQALVLLQALSQFDTFRMLDERRFLQLFHWSLLAQPAPLPENLLRHDPDDFLMTFLSKSGDAHETFSDKALSEYRSCFSQESVRHAMCEDFRAGITLDLAHDGDDQAADRDIKAPLLVLWSDMYYAGMGIEPLEVWRFWADDVSGMGLSCGHFMMEERPVEVATRMAGFLDQYL